MDSTTNNQTNTNTPPSRPTKENKVSRVAIWLLLGGAIVIAALVFASWFFGGERIPDYVGYPLEGEQKEAVIEQNSPPH